MALQMSWQQNSSLPQRRKSNPPLGLKNLGNTCYLNSVLQCLTYTPPLANFCLNCRHTSLCDSHQNCPFCILEKRIVRSLTLESFNVDSPSKIHSCLTLFAHQFRHGRQEDAHEFLRLVLDSCHNACIRVKNPKFNLNPNVSNSQSIINDIFGGALRSQVKCVSCGSESNKMDEIMDISLDLFQTSSLKDALQRFFQLEVLDGCNKYKCEKCKKLVTARKQMSILKAPNVLVIQLKRFEGIHGGKIDRTISFEEVLMLSGYMCKESQDPYPEYNLFGTIVHLGDSHESGHYYAYIKDVIGRWYCCNDAHVSLSTLQEVLSEKVYILFYSRTNQRPQTSRAAFATNGVKYPHSTNDAQTSPIASTPLKTMATKRHEAHHLDKDKPTICSNGKVPSNPMIKCDNLKNAHANGNGNGHVQKCGFVERPLVLKESVVTEKIKKDLLSVINNDGGSENKSSDSLDHKSKHTSSVPYGNGDIQGIDVKSVKIIEACEENGAEHLVAKVQGPEKDENGLSNISGRKRKSLDEESQNLLSEDAYQMEEVKFKELLTEEVSSALRSCGWYDEVYSFMHARKRSCAESAGITNSEIELKKILIAEAKQPFLSQIPESLKQHLIDHLRTFMERTQFSDR